jgi:hypothetical protein
MIRLPKMFSVRSIAGQPCKSAWPGIENDADKHDRRPLGPVLAVSAESFFWEGSEILPIALFF